MTRACISHLTWRLHCTTWIPNLVQYRDIMHNAKQFSWGAQDCMSRNGEWLWILHCPNIECLEFFWILALQFFSDWMCFHLGSRRLNYLHRAIMKSCFFNFQIEKCRMWQLTSCFRSHRRIITKQECCYSVMGVRQNGFPHHYRLHFFLPLLLMIN